MAAALFRRGTALCVRCIHRELRRLVWKPHAALFSSKSSDRKQPRRTHIKKAKPQPAVDVAKLLEQLFSQRRPDTPPLAADRAHPAKASSTPTKPPTTSSRKVAASNVLLLSKTQPAVFVFPAASRAAKKTTSVFNTAQQSPQPKSVSPTKPKTSLSSEIPHQSPVDFVQAFASASLSNETVPTTSASPQTSTTPESSGSEAVKYKTVEANLETATEPFHLTTVPQLPYMIEMNVETSSFQSATVEHLKTAAESPVDSSLPLIEVLETRAPVAECPVEPTVDALAEEVQTKSIDSGVTDISHTANEEPLIENTTESPVEGCLFPMETLKTSAAAFEGPVEPTLDTAAKGVQTKTTAVTATGSPAIDTVAAETDDFPASPALNEVLLEQEVEEEGAQTEALGNEEGTDLDPVQKLFLEKIREYKNLQRLTGGPAEADPDYRRYLSEETAKLQKLYGGGDLSSFPQFTFPEPNTDQDSK